ncbi:Golgi apparatus membrane protein tvp23 [Entomophthora muscae]|uniref:Golgi apparatus membrane protein tvp23 n=1 Tax=Entomophthora muscae TaxID=34485 RepID=A0ACC2TQW9_9FUNG|nr:Golgi apparatus membrane protein tvp23 [Entomophthora muscae]
MIISSPMLVQWDKAKNEIVPDNVSINMEGTSSAPPPTYSNNNAQNETSTGAVSQMLKNSSHPKILLVHFFFRTIAILIYLVINFFVNNFVFVFVISALALAFDFWIVKNVSGRYLVGLRWWNEVDPFGDSQWYFESRDATFESNVIDAKIFWVSLYATPIIWGFLALIALIKTNFQWLLIVAFALMLSISNLVGYYKCDKFAKQKAGQNQGLESSLFGSTGGLVGGFINRSVTSLFG